MVTLDFFATYHRIKRLFAWSNQKRMVKAYVQACTICQQAKSERVLPPGLLQPLSVPDQAWTIVTMDFIEGLPKSATYDTILVVVDKFSKYAHFLPLKHPFTALHVAKLYMSHVFKLHGLPQAIISDRDRIFTSSLWQELFKLSQTTLRLSSSYHPQTDGQTEHVNQCLETYLRCAVHACPKNWYHWLALAEYWYNTSYHTSLGLTPFEVLYGHKPRDFGTPNLDECTVSDVATWMKERAIMTQLLHQHLERAQHRMKHHADKHRTDRHFDVGDQVYLKLQPHIQSSVAHRPNQKLSFRYYGPFPIEAKVGSVAYKLRLPSSSQIHPVIHVSQLKKAVNANTVVSPNLPPVPSVLQEPKEPEYFIDRKLVKSGKSIVARVLVKWLGLDDNLATWEDLQQLRHRFPDSPAWGQAGFQGEEIVTTEGRRQHNPETA